MQNIIPISGTMPIMANEKTTGVNGAQNANVPFADILQDSIRNLQETQAVSQKDAYDLAMGRSDDLHTIAIHSAQATAALEMTVQVATRAVNAYKEILQMQV